MSNKNIFNIKSNYNFLESLVYWLLSNYSDPLYLSNITILLPSRRACREIKKIFLKQVQKEAIILPKIKAIGDVDYDELSLIQNYYPNSHPVLPLKYHLLLIEDRLFLLL